MGMFLFSSSALVLSSINPDPVLNSFAISIRSGDIRTINNYSILYPPLSSRLGIFRSVFLIYNGYERMLCHTSPSDVINPQGITLEVLVIRISNVTFLLKKIRLVCHEWDGIGKSRLRKEVTGRTVQWDKLMDKKIFEINKFKIASRDCPS